jgi:hypothetical protein
LSRLSQIEQHKPCFDEACSKLLDQRKQVKLQWLQDPRKINGDNQNDIKHEASRHFRNKKGNIWKIKLMSLQQKERTIILETSIKE